MKILNIEIKSRVQQPETVVKRLEIRNAKYMGTDHQRDTYFNAPVGRLKLRQGNVENALIYYQRSESLDLKRSEVKLQQLPKENKELLTILCQLHGVKTVVDKVRRIYYIDNVKFHVDEVKGLGYFVEIEACDRQGRFDELELKRQCDFYIDYLGLDRNEFIDKSYSDMVIFSEEEIEEIPVTERTEDALLI